MPSSVSPIRLRRKYQRRFTTILVASIGILAGCPIVPPVSLRDTRSSLPAKSTDTRELLERIDSVLAANRQHRQLSTDVHGGWQILHGVLAYGRDLKISSPEGEVAAVEYLLRGGPVKGFELRSGDRFEDNDSPQPLADSPQPLAESPQNAPESTAQVANDDLRTRGIRTELDPGSKLGQGHRDQWLAYMASCRLPMDQVIQTLDGPRQIGLWVRQIEWNVPLNFEREYSWTLLSLLPYRETAHRWTARDGNDYSIESLLRSELDQLSPDSACGGSHRLVAISTALNKRKSEGAAINGVWADAQELIDNAIDQALEFQNEDSSFSSNYFERPGWSLDLVSAIGTTGHTLEFIAVGGTDSIIHNQAVTDAATKLCDLLEQTSHIDLECGALYHALSGLQIYRKRLAATASS